MQVLHYTANFECAGDGTYNYRLYALLPDPLDNLFTLPAIDMGIQYQYLVDLAPVPIDFTDHLISSGSFHEGAESETLQGIPQFENLKLTLDSDPMFLPLWNMIRAPNAQVWLEVTLDQTVLNVPAFPPTGAGSINWPRKKRSIFWGQLLPHDSLMKIIEQDLTQGRTPQIERGTVDHDGTIDLPFVHWLKVFTSFNYSTYGFAPTVTVVGWLATLIPSVLTGDYYISLTQILDSLIGAISPTLLYVINALPVHEFDFPVITIPETITNGSTGQTNDLSEIKVKMVSAGVLTALFFNDPHGSNTGSFYGFTSLADALFKLASEFNLFPQVELPCMEEAYASLQATHAGTGPANVRSQQIKYWPGVTRWIFSPLDGFTDRIWVEPNESTIEFSPSANFASSESVSNPTVDGLLPAPSTTKIYSPLVGGTAESRTTLFRFMGYEYVGTWVWDTVHHVWIYVNVPTDSPRGWELYVTSFGLTTPARSVIYNGITYTNWAYFEAEFLINRWGRARSILKFEQNSVGLNPFGIDTTNDSKAIPLATIKDFGLHDFGDFPLLRKLGAKIGLMDVQSGDVIAYQLFDIERTPDPINGSITKLAFIEVGEFAESATVLVDATPPPPPGPPTTQPQGPPTLNITAPPGGVGAANLSGTQTIVVTPSLGTVPIANLKVYAAGVLLDYMQYPNSGLNFNVTWDTTKDTNGVVPVTVLAFDYVGQMSTTTVNMNIHN